MPDKFEEFETSLQKLDECFSILFPSVFMDENHSNNYVQSNDQPSAIMMKQVGVARVEGAGKVATADRCNYADDSLVAAQNSKYTGAIPHDSDGMSFIGGLREGQEERAPIEDQADEYQDIDWIDEDEIGDNIEHTTNRAESDDSNYRDGHGSSGVIGVPYELVGLISII